MAFSSDWLSTTGQKIIEQACSWLTIYGIKMVGSPLILNIGLWATKILTRLTRRLLTARSNRPWSASAAT